MASCGSTFLNPDLQIGLANSETISPVKEKCDPLPDELNHRDKCTERYFETDFWKVFKRDQTFESLLTVFTHEALDFYFGLF